MVLFVAGCGGAAGGQGSSGDGALEVVATYSILGNMVENVGGKNIGLTTLVGPDSDAHTFEPAPTDNAKLAKAAVVFENGLGFEPWLKDLYESSGSSAEMVTVTRGIEPLDSAGDEHAGEEAYGGPDPHAWHDPEAAVVMVENIRDALAEADPDNAGFYRRNAEEYVAEIEELDAEVRERVDEIPEENRVLFTSHDTFGYFARRYGFGVDTALASVSTEASDPSAQETAGLIEEIEASGVPAIFADNVSNPDVMERVASEAGVELAPPLYTDALGEPGTEGETYLKMIRYNASTISGALSR